MQQLRQLLGKLQLQTNTPTAQDHTVEARSSRRTRATYRLREIHTCFNRESLEDALCSYFSIEKSGVVVHSLAYDAPYGRSSRQKVATVTFKSIPDTLQTGNRWPIKLPLSEESNELCDVCFDTTFEGFTPLTPTGLEDTTDVDCILIHGWAGHSIGSFSSPDGEWFWPRDGLCHDIPTLRVWLYGYSSDLRDSGSVTDVYEYADTFRRALVDARRSPDPKATLHPLIFIVHSLGGWILQDAIIRMAASNNPDDKINLEMTKGALLFGVPTTGMDNQEIIGLLQEDNLPAVYTASLLDKRYGFRQHMKQADDFHDACSKSKAITYAFYETEKTPTVCRDKETQRWARNGPPALLVDQNSATYGRFEHRNKIPWQSNHNNMLKFRRGDLQYETLLGRLRETLQNIKQNQEAYETLTTQLSNDQKECLQSLAFPEMNYRKNDISVPTEGTCNWLFQHSIYQDWITGKNSILWIKGHPGTGKSTIMSYALDLSGALPSDSIILSYFFNGRGSDIQKDLSGMYRSFLHQLLSFSTQLASDLVSLYVAKRTTRGLVGDKWSWQERELRDEFQKIVLQIAQKRNVRIYVDALDEAGEDNAKKFLSLSKSLTGQDKAMSQIAICFSSRHYPSVSFGSSLEIRMEQENEDDIKTYIETKLSASDFDDSMTEVREVILKKADRSFQWATIVVDRIIDLHEQGQNSSFLLDIVSTTPQDLTELYRYLLAQIKGDDDRALALRVFQWIVFAKRPLTLTEMRFALVLKEEITSWKSCISSKFYPHDDQAMQKRLRALSAGLAEVRHPEAFSRIDSISNTTQLIHQSVLDFLMKEGLASLGCQLLPDVATVSQLLLTRLCFFRAVMKTDAKFINREAWDTMGSEELPDADSFEDKFKKDNGRNMIEWYRNHCETLSNSESTIGSSTESDSSSELGSEIESDTESEPESDDESNTDSGSESSDELDWESDSTSKTSSEANSWEEYETDSGSDSIHQSHPISNQRYDRAYSEWMKECRWEMYQMQCFPLLKYCLTYVRNHLQAIDAAQDTVYVQGGITSLLYGEHSLLPAWLKVNESTFQVHRFGSSCTMLHLAAKWELKFLFDISMETGLDTNLIDTISSETPLHMSAGTKRGQYITKILLQQESIDVNLATNTGSTVLRRSLWNCQFEAVKILLARDDINVRAISKSNESALSVAMFRAVPARNELPESELEFPEIKEIIEMLLRRDDIDLNSKDNTGRTALMNASMFSTEAIAQLLLEHGAQINDQDHEGNSALHYAANWDHPQMIKLLLSNGADSSLKTKDGQTAAHLAAEMDHPDALEALLDDISIDAQDDEGQTLLHYAAEQEDTRMMKLLLKANPGVSIQDRILGETAAHFAISYGLIDALVLLLESGADPKATDYGGVSLLHLAADEGDLQAIELLLDAGADLIVKDLVKGETAAHYAISSKNPVALGLLLQKAASPNTADDDDETLLHCAAKVGDLRSVELLLHAEADTTLQDVRGKTAFLATGEALCKHLGIKKPGKGVVNRILHRMDDNKINSREHQKAILLSLVSLCFEQEANSKDANQKKSKKRHIRGKIKRNKNRRTR